MKFALLALPGLLTAAVSLPPGTNLEIRLTTPVSSSTAHVKSPVAAILIAPLIADGRVALGAGAALTGSVASVRPAVSEQDVTPMDAALKLEFSQLTTADHTYRIATRLYSADNVRESVDATGTILGISAKKTLTGRIDQGLGKMQNSRYSSLAQLLGKAKEFLLKNADPNISFEAGTEMTLRLSKPLILLDPPPPATPGVPDDGNLSILVNNQVWQTYAQRPPAPSDVTNLLFIGNAEQIAAAFEQAGWGGSKALSGESRFETAKAIIEQRGYKEAPVSIIYLGNHPPDFVFQKGNNTFSARHHIRIWQSLDTYQGRQVWLCAATHDIGIDFSQADGTFIHKIDSNIDLERTKITDDLLLTGFVHGVTLVPRPALPTHFRNATGDDVNTDARMAVLQF